MFDDAHVTDTVWMGEQAACSRERLLPRIEARFEGRAEPAAWQAYEERLGRHFPRLFALLHSLYGDRYDFFCHLEAILTSATARWMDRPAELEPLDARRMADPHWYQSSRMVGATCYVDLFAGDLDALRQAIPYLTELGVSYLHLIAVLRSPEADNDGGYAE